MMDDIRRRAEDDVYGKVAAQVRADKKMLDDFVANPDISRYGIADLERMKAMTAYDYADYPNDDARQAALRGVYYSEEVTYGKRDVLEYGRYSDLFFEVQDNSPFYAAKNIYKDKDRFRQYLTPQEWEWLNTYDHRRDMIVFKALVDKLKDLGRREKRHLMPSILPGLICRWIPLSDMIMT